MDATALGQLLNYGVLGIFAVLLVLFARTLLKREQDRGDTAQAEVTRLNNLIQDKIIPALIGATGAVTSAQTILQTLKYKQDVEDAAGRLGSTDRRGSGAAQ